MNLYSTHNAMNSITIAVNKKKIPVRQMAIMNASVKAKANRCKLLQENIECCF